MTPSQCQGDGCFGKFIKTEAISYCYNHEKECPIQSCQQRITNHEDYCSIHKDYKYYTEMVEILTLNLSEKEARQVLGSHDNFSFIRGNICSELNCDEEIGTCFQRCSNHKKLCQVRGCEKIIEYLGDYCNSHLNASLKDCGFYGCNNQVANPENYCRQHQ